MAVEPMSCSRIVDFVSGLNVVWRCENSEAICYIQGATSQDAALACKFKEVPPPTVKKWYGDMKKAESLIKTAKGRVVWGANFSVGMNVFMKVVRESSKLFSKFEQYGVSGLEIHHAEKKDNPSGTAIKLGQVIDSEYARGSKVKGRKQALGAAGKVTFAGVRVGSEPGTHTVLFDSAVDTVELTHRARSREGFALGAILAAEWICEQKPQFYSFENHFEDMIS
jgi:4-hydroxy-tetrahydrodipicolinate reductase